MINKLGFFLGAVGLGLALASCSSNEANDEVVIWAWNKNVDAIQKSIDVYKEKVDSSFIGRVESFARNDIDKKFKTAAQTNNLKALPDISLVDGINLLTYYDLWSSSFLDIKDYVSDEEFNKLVPAAAKRAKLDGKLIGLPIDVAPTVVFANTTLWDSTKLKEVRENGWTWEEYFNIGKEINSKNSDVYMSAYNLRIDDRIYRSITNQKGQWYFDINNEVTFGNEISVEAMTYVKKLYDNKVLGHIDTGDYKSLMKNNKIAAQIQGFFLGGQLKDVAPEMSGKWEILPLPKWNAEDPNTSVITGGSYLTVNSGLNGKKKDQAVDFVKFMTTKEESSINSLRVGGVYPALRTAYDEPYFKDTRDEYFSNDNVWSKVAAWSVDANAINPTKYWAYNDSVFAKVQEKIIFTNSYNSIEEELKRAAELIRKNAK